MRWLLAFALISGTARAAESDLAVPARTVLVKHCRPCHAGEKPRDGLLVLDHTKFAAADRRVLEVIADGSMPPGRHAKLSAAEMKVLRDWSAGGRPAYPEKFDDAFAASAIATDKTKLPPGGERSTVHVSFHHLLADDDRPTDPAPFRAALVRALSDLTGVADALTPAEPTGTVWRLNLKPLNWGHSAFQRFDGWGPDNTPTFEPDRNFTTFDLVRLEYPAKDPWLRGDWLAEALAKDPLAADLGRLAGTNKRPAAPSAAAAPIVPRPRPESPAWPNITSPDLSDLTVNAVSPDGAKLNRLRPGDDFFLKVTASKPIHVRVYYADPDPKDEPYRIFPPQKSDPRLPNFLIGESDTTPLPLPKNNALGTLRVIVFARTTPFPREPDLLIGTLGGKRLPPVFRFRYTDPADWNGVSKKTLEIPIEK